MFYGSKAFLFFSLGGPFPELEVTNPHHDQIITNLMHFLEQRINKRNILRADLQEKRKYWKNLPNKIFLFLKSVNIQFSSRDRFQKNVTDYGAGKFKPEGGKRLNQGFSHTTKEKGTFTRA